MSKWIKRTHFFSSDKYECSSCGRQFDRPSAACPGCGAAMRGSQYDPSWGDEVEMLDAIFDD